MSIATDLTRLQTAKADLKTAIEGKGVTVPSATKIDGYADLVDAIQTGGGGYTIDELATKSQPSGAVTITVPTIAQNGLNYFTELTDVITTETTTINRNSLTNCTSLKTVTCPKVTNIAGNDAFAWDTALETALFPKLTTVAGTGLFNGCTSLEYVDFGEANTIGANVFNNCRKLATLVLRKTGTITTLGNVSAFGNTPMRGYNSLNGTIYVPSALIETYKTATNWSTIFNEGHVTFSAIEGSQYE